MLIRYKNLLLKIQLNNINFEKCSQRPAGVFGGVQCERGSFSQVGRGHQHWDNSSERGNCRRHQGTVFVSLELFEKCKALLCLSMFTLVHFILRLIVPQFNKVHVLF